ERHHLILMTKGAIAEQSGKVERSGLKDYFSAIEIVAEKDAATYRSITSKYAFANDSTWMVGNSPKSDINPALAAGLACGKKTAPVPPEDVPPSKQERSKQ